MRFNSKLINMKFFHAGAQVEGSWEVMIKMLINADEEIF